jgi:D-alanyl-D-alanine carboxypeptidase
MRTLAFSILAFASATAGVALVVALVFGMPEIGRLLGLPANADDVMDLELRSEFFLEDGDWAVFATSTRVSGSIAEDAPEIDRPGKAVVADLTKMKIWTYEDGKAVNEFSILSKGKPGSAWETPPGEYGVKYKAENHLSSIGGVYMPYSMQFFGNFFIHGWPYYTNGTPVAEGYSGGCIRLADEDAKTIFEFVETGTPILVFGDGASTTPEAVAADAAPIDDGRYALLSNARVPKVTALSYLVADLDTGDIILEKNMELERPIASLTKLMTALVSLEVVNQFSETTVSKRAAGTYGDQGNLYAGERVMVRDLLYPLLLESSNDAAEAIAEVQGRDYFMKSMNDKAKSIGLDQTNFDDASGLSQHNTSTAHDLFELTRYIHKYKRYILDVTERQSQVVGDRTWRNISRFKNDEGYMGGKNGYTDEAMHTLITTFELPLAEFEDRNVSIILLGSQNKEEDARALLSYVNQYVYYTHDE